MRKVRLFSTVTLTLTENLFIWQGDIYILFIERVNSEGAMKVRVEVTNAEGVKDSFEREGDLQIEMLKQVTISDAIKFLEKQLAPHSVEQEYLEGQDFTIKQRLINFLKYSGRTPTGWFTSSQIKKTYEAYSGENVRLSTISTYLADLYSHNILERRGSRSLRLYRLTPLESRKAAQAVDYSVDRSPELRNSLFNV